MAVRDLGLTDSDVDEMVRLWNQGYNCQEIGKRFGCLSGSVHARLQKRGVRLGIRHRARLTRHSNGYLLFGQKYVHRIVAEAWIGRPLRSDEHVHHLDGDKTNNHPDNLRVLTHSQHMRLHGAESERWTADQDRTLLQMLVRNYSDTVIARHVGFSPEAVSNRMKRLRRRGVRIPRRSFGRKRDRKLEGYSGLPGNARLTMAQAREIRVAYQAGGVTQYQLADQYGVHQSCIWEIVHNKSYAESA